MSTILPSIQAATYQVYAFVNFAPNPIGVGQTGICLFFLDRPAPTAAAGFGSATNWNGFTLTVTHPDGTTTEKFGPFTSDATGGYFVSYTPNVVGKYTFRFDFPGQSFNNGAYVVSAASATTTLAVTQTPQPAYQTPPLPTNYWSFPIYGENRGWYQIAGNWISPTYGSASLPSNPYNPYTAPVMTAHIVWTRAQNIGGVVGGTQFSNDSGLNDWNFYLAPTYQSYWGGGVPLVMGGRLYYMEREVPGNGWVGMHCVDLMTGKQLWFQPVTVTGQVGAMGGGTLATIIGQLLDAETVNGHGFLPYFWNNNGNNNGNWTMFDANSGMQILTAYSIPTTANSPGVTGPVYAYDGHGALLAYFINGAKHWLVMWNSSLLITSVTGSVSVYTPPVGAQIPWKNGIQWNVTIPTNFPGEVPTLSPNSPMVDSKVIFAQTGSNTIDSDNVTVEAYDANTGAQLWYHTFGDPYIPGTTNYEFFGPIAGGVMTIYQKAARQWYGYDELTGVKLWGPTQAYTNAWDTFAIYSSDGSKLYVGTYAGQVYCHDIKTGKLLWTYTLPPSGGNTPYGTYSLSNGITVAGGEIFVYTGEHTPNSPYWLGGAMYAVNATDGKLVYSMSGWWSLPIVVVDGMSFSFNSYDGRIYGFGKGPTSMTLSTPDLDLTLGQSLTIKGTVMDESPGSLDYPGNRISTTATPAIADTYMTQWMQYLYQQKPIPTNATGVAVTLSVVDSNNNFRQIGTTVSDTDGFYSFNWKPDIPGKYTLYASFEGSDSYWPSHAVTAFTVVPAPAAASQPTNQPLSVIESYFVPAVIGIIVAIFIVGVVLALLLLRKR